MIALDTSALIAIALNEPEEDDFIRLIALQGALIGTPTLLETALVLKRRLPDFADSFLKIIWTHQDIQTVPFCERMLDAAQTAFMSYGKGRHPAALNFGDCMAYAVAKVRDCPLLFKGQDFTRTDIVPAFA